MAAHIPFLTGPEVGKLARSVFSDSEYFRLPLDRAPSLRQYATTAKLWVDPMVDGCDNISNRISKKGKPNRWYEFMKKITAFEKLNDPTFLVKPNASDIDDFVNHLLDKCLEQNPTWITIPQLPCIDGSGRNKINRALSIATGKWKVARSFTGRLILPVVMTHQNQVNNKSSRNPKVKLAAKCYQESRADGIWVVDQSLSDDSGSSTLQRKRFPGIISLHEELNEAISTKIRVAGPYWGLNLVLWAKGVVDYPAIGVGTGNQYLLSGGPSRSGRARIALPALRRRVTVTPKLGPWLDKVILKLDVKNPVRAEFEKTRERLTFLNDRNRARAQVARFYKRWYDELASNPKSGRTMALFQDLASAYALGRSLPALDDEGVSRRPESVVEPLMINCL